MGFDVFNALDLMDNKEFLEKLKFGVGDGNLQYYLYNWKCPVMVPQRVSEEIFYSSFYPTLVCLIVRYPTPSRMLHYMS